MKQGFTLLEVLISIALLSIVMLALNKSVTLLRDSNTKLFEHLDKAKEETKMLNVLYADISASNGDISIEKKEFSRLCINETIHSLYELPSAKVCWIVLKEENQLIRIEGNGYDLPIDEEERVEVDLLTKNIDIFDVYYEKGKVLVVIREKDKEAMSFMIQGLAETNTTTQPTTGQAIK